MQICISKMVTWSSEGRISVNFFFDVPIPWILTRPVERHPDELETRKSVFNTSFCFLGCDVCEAYKFYYNDTDFFPPLRMRMYKNAQKRL